MQGGQRGTSWTGTGQQLCPIVCAKHRCSHMTETTIRTLGGLAQLFGVLLVALGVWQTRRGFTERPGILGGVSRTAKRTLDRLKQSIPRRRRGQVVQVGLAAEGEAATGLRARVTRRFEGLTFDQLRSRLETALNGLQKEVDTLRETIEAEGEKRARGLESEREAREIAIEELRSQIEIFAGSNLRLEATGAALFFAGIVLTTWAPEIASLVG